MSEATISVRIGSDKKAALDAIAARTHRDLSLVIDAALSAYLELQAWQVEHLEEGMRQADAGEFASSTHVRAALARWRRGRSGGPGRRSRKRDMMVPVGRSSSGAGSIASALLY